MAGFFVSFEGGEGCGKSTQISLLMAHWQAAGRRVLQVREPGGTAIGEVIRHLLKYHPENGAMTREAELLLFAASRAQLVREKIEPFLAEDGIVVADRFLDSTTVYQGSGRDLPADQVAAINDFAAGTCRPDVTFLLDLDAVKPLTPPVPRVLASACKALPEPGEPGRAWTVEGVGDTPAIVLLSCPQPPRKITLEGTPDPLFEYDAPSQLLRVRFLNTAGPRRLALEF
jgi:dTMP kinase